MDYYQNADKIRLQHQLSRYYKENYGTYNIAKGTKRIEQKMYWTETSISDVIYDKK